MFVSLPEAHWSSVRCVPAARSLAVAWWWISNLSWTHPTIRLMSSEIVSSSAQWMHASFLLRVSLCWKCARVCVYLSDQHFAQPSPHLFCACNAAQWDFIRLLTAVMTVEAELRLPDSRELDVKKKNFWNHAKEQRRTGEWPTSGSEN